MSEQDARSSADLTLPGLVHDLNNIFETISDAAELLASDERWRELAGTLLRSVDRGRRIVGVYADQNRAGAELSEVVDRAETFLCTGGRNSVDIGRNCSKTVGSPGATKGHSIVRH